MQRKYFISYPIFEGKERLLVPAQIYSKQSCHVAYFLPAGGKKCHVTSFSPLDLLPLLNETSMETFSMVHERT